MMNLNNTGPKTHFAKLDIIRIIACFAVIIIHITATPVVHYPPNSPHQVFFLILNRLAKPSVPIFIFLSGFLNYHPDRIFSFQPFVKKWLRLFTPYFIWTLVYYAFFVSKGIYPLSLNFLTKHLVIGNMVYHLYFMVILLQLMLINPLLTFVSKTIGEKWFFFLMASLQVCFAFITIPYKDRIFLTYIAYYAAGFLLKKLKEHRALPGLSVLSFTISALCYLGISILGMNFGFVFPGFWGNLIYMAYSLSTCFAMFWLIKERPLSRQTKTFAQATENIYYAHPFALMISSSLLTHLGVFSTIANVVLSTLLVLVLIVPLSYEFTILKINYGKGPSTIKSS